MRMRPFYFLNIISLIEAPSWYNVSIIYVYGKAHTMTHHNRIIRIDKLALGTHDTDICVRS